MPWAKLFYLRIGWVASNFNQVFKKQPKGLSKMVQVSAKVASGCGPRPVLLTHPHLFSLPLSFPLAGVPGTSVIAASLHEQSSLLYCLTESSAEV